LFTATHSVVLGRK